MWIITSDGFVSLVAHETKPDYIRARARRFEHLQETFDLSDGDITDFGENASDYRFHADIPKPHVAQKLYDAIMDLSYSSHVKENVAGNDAVFYSAMLGCWRELHRLQVAEPEYPDFADDDDVPTLGDLGDIVGQIGELADRMRAGAGRPLVEQEVQVPLDPLPVKRATSWFDTCAICDGQFKPGDDYVTLPEDDEFGEPEAPAHVLCAEEDGWTVAK